MFKVQLLNPIANVGLRQFPQEIYPEINTDIVNPHAILVRSNVMHDMTFPKSLQVVGRAGAGVNNIPIAKLTALGIPVLNTPGANANAVQELVLAGMLLASRNLFHAFDYIKQLPADDDLEDTVEKNKKQFVGFELAGKTLGVVGLGAIGVKVANSALNLGMRVLGYDPAITTKRAWELESQVEQAQRLDYLLSQADFISFHVPLTPDTMDMIHAEKFALMKNNVTLLNFARDGLIDKIALKEVLAQKKVRAYVSDFPCKFLKDSPGVISLPHLGASTKEAEDNCARMIVNQVRNYLEHGNIENAVNFPNVDLLYTNHPRLALVNANIPNMVAQISTVLAEHGLNIIDLVNKSKENIAYTLVDLNHDFSETVLAKMAEIPGVIQVRRIDPKAV